MKVVSITADQIDRVVPLFDAYRQFYGKPSDPAGCREFLSQRLSRHESVILAVVEGEQALGFVQLYPSFSSVSMKRIFILNDLYVLDSARRKGVAVQLLNAAKQHGIQAGAIRLELSTAVTNIAAQALYEREGWIRDQDYYHYELNIQRASS